VKCPRAFFLVFAVATTLSGCVSTKYEMASKDTPPAVPLNIATVQPPVALKVSTVISYKGPGSWKQEALWDEYVVVIHNQGDQPLTIRAAALLDPGGEPRAPGSDPWDLEKESQTLEQRYLRAGVAFVRAAGPGVLILGAGAAAVASAGIFSAAAGTAATATVIALPVYYVVVFSVNHSNKNDVVAEFARRRLNLPLTLTPGESRTGSLFFPMTPNPQALNLQYLSAQAAGEAVLTLEALHGLHVKNEN